MARPACCWEAAAAVAKQTAAAAAAAAAAGEATAAGLDIGGLKPHQAIVLDGTPLVHHQPDVLALARRLVDLSTAIACLGLGLG